MTVLIDRLREEIQQRLDQLTGEAVRLRKALVALDPRSPKSTVRKPAARKSTVAKPVASRAIKPRAAKQTPARRKGQATSRTTGRTARGATKASVLAALADGVTMTAGEVAAKSGLGRPTVSTTLTRLAKSGEVEKAERGYRLAPAPTI